MFEFSSIVSRRHCVYVILLYCLFAPRIFSVDFGIFGDVNLSNSDKNNSKGEQDFSLGGLDLYATQEVGEKSKAFMELVFEGIGNEFIVDLERLWIKYSFANAFKIAAGRFHTPLGFWNTNYHHGSLIQDTVTRPFFLDFEDGTAGVLPMHMVGLNIGGQLALGRSILDYQLFSANNPSLDSTVKKDASGNPIVDASGNFVYAQSEIFVNNVVDPGKKKAFAASLSWEYAPIGTELGLFTSHTHYIDVNEASYGAIINRQDVYGLDFRINNKYFYTLMESFLMYNFDPQKSREFLASAWYVQVGARASSNLTIIYRHSELKHEKNDIYFNILIDNSDAQLNIQQEVIGLRYNVDESNAIKLEHQINKESNATFIQWSFLLF